MEESEQPEGTPSISIENVGKEVGPSSAPPNVDTADSNNEDLAGFDFGLGIDFDSIDASEFMQTGSRRSIIFRTSKNPSNGDLSPWTAQNPVTNPLQAAAAPRSFINKKARKSSVDVAKQGNGPTPPPKPVEGSEFGEDQNVNADASAGITTTSSTSTSTSPPSKSSSKTIKRKDRKLGASGGTKRGKTAQDLDVQTDTLPPSKSMSSFGQDLLNSSGSVIRIFENRQDTEMKSMFDPASFVVEDYGKPEILKHIVFIQKNVRRDIVKRRVAKMKRQRKRRLDIVKEIFYSEKRYLKGLETIINLYLTPLSKASGADALISQSDISIIFSNISVIYNLNRELMSRLEPIVESWNNDTSLLGPVFLELAPFLKFYTQYCSNHEAAMQLVSELIKQKPKWAKYFTDMKKHPEAENRDLLDLLITPVQRIPRYLLLLTDFQRNTFSWHADHPSLTKALKIVSEVADHVNASFHMLENMNKIIEIQRVVAGDYINLVEPARKFVRQGTIVKNGQSRQYFLFSDMLLWAQKTIGTGFRYRGHLMLHTTWIHDIPDEANIRNSFQIVSEQKTYTVRAESASEKVEWINAIENCIAVLVDKDPSLCERRAPVRQRTKRVNRLLSKRGRTATASAISPMSGGGGGGGGGGVVMMSSSTPQSQRSASLSAGSISVGGGGGGGGSDSTHLPLSSIPTTTTTTTTSIPETSDLTGGPGALGLPTLPLHPSLASLSSFAPTTPLPTVAAMTLPPSEKLTRAMIPSPEFEGMLTKQGVTFTSWRKRLFVLSDKFLYYFRETKSTAEPAGIIPLREASVANAEAVTKKRFCFEIRTRIRTYFIFARSKTQMESWMNVLRKAIGSPDAISHKGIPPVLAQLTGGSKAVVGQATALLKAHCRSEAGGREVIENGAIPMLFHVLISCKVESVIVDTAMVLAELAIHTELLTCIRGERMYLNTLLHHLTSTRRASEHLITLLVALSVSPEESDALRAKTEGESASTRMIHSLLLLIRSSSLIEVREQGMHCLSKLAGDSFLRGEIFACGSMNVLAESLLTGGQGDMLREFAARTVGYLARNDKNRKFMRSEIVSALLDLISTPNPALAEATAFALKNLAVDPLHRQFITDNVGLPPLLSLISTKKHESVVLESVEALRYFAGSASGKEAILDAGGLPRLIDLLSIENLSIQEHACRCLANLCYTERIEEDLRDLNGLPPLFAILKSYNGKDSSKHSLLESALRVLVSVTRHDGTNRSLAIDRGILPILESFTHSQPLIEQALCVILHLSQIQQAQTVIADNETFLPQLLAISSSIKSKWVCRVTAVNTLEHLVKSEKVSTAMKERRLLPRLGDFLLASKELTASVEGICSQLGIELPVATPSYEQEIIRKEAEQKQALAERERRSTKHHKSTTAQALRSTIGPRKGSSLSLSLSDILSSPAETVIAEFGWEPEDNEEEVELREGDEVSVFLKNDDDWWYGEVKRTQKRGFFPSVYVVSK